MTVGVWCPRRDGCRFVAEQHSYAIDIQPDGKVDVTRNRRAWRYDLDDVDEALRVIRRAEGRGVPVTLIEQDGYRRKVST